MILTLKQQVLFRTIILIVIIIIASAIYINGKNLSCDKCNVNFDYEKVGQSNKLSVQMNKLYNEFLNNESCLVRNFGEGFVYNGELQNNK